MVRKFTQDHKDNQHFFIHFKSKRQNFKDGFELQINLLNINIIFRNTFLGHLRTMSGVDGDVHHIWLWPASPQRTANRIFLRSLV